MTLDYRERPGTKEKEHENRPVYRYVLPGNQRRGDELPEFAAGTDPARPRGSRLRPEMQGLGGEPAGKCALSGERTAAGAQGPQLRLPHAAHIVGGGEDRLRRGAHQQRICDGDVRPPRRGQPRLRAGAHLSHRLGGLHLLHHARRGGRGRAADRPEILPVVVQPL